MNPVLCFVDDDYPTNRYNEIILSTIKEIGSFKIYDDSQIALTTLNAADQKPNFLFLDINMPRLNGWEFVEEIHKSPSDFLAAPYGVFMLTTSVSDNDRKQQERYPLIQRMIEKPLTEKIILDILHTTNQRISL